MASGLLTANIGGNQTVPPPNQLMSNVSNVLPPGSSSPGNNVHGTPPSSVSGSTSAVGAGNVVRAKEFRFTMAGFNEAVQESRLYPYGVRLKAAIQRNPKRSICIFVAALVIFITGIVLLTLNGQGFFTSAPAAEKKRCILRLHIKQSESVRDKEEDYPDHCVTPELERDIVIRCHGVPSMPDFCHVPTIKYGHMTGNPWVELKTEAFGNMPGLLRLDLSKNLIRNIHNSTFHGVTKLTNLSLDTNEISSIQQGTFQILINLQSLKLGGNKLTKLDNGMLTGLRSLLSLQLSRNSIQTIDGDSFKTMSELREIFLDNNELEQLQEEVFDPLSNLIRLDLSHNSLEVIVAELFAKTIALTELYLQHNKIATIESKTFVALNFKQDAGGKLILANNEIVLIHGGAFNDGACLKELDVRDNPLNCSSVENLPQKVDYKYYPQSSACHVDGNIEDKCAKGNNNCGTYGKCTMKDEEGGIFACTCEPGYSGQYCNMAINECENTAEPPCNRHATCEDTPGSFTCTCSEQCLRRRGVVPPVSNSTSRLVFIAGTVLLIILIFYLTYRRMAGATKPEEEEEGKGKKRKRSKTRAGRRRSTRSSRRTSRRKQRRRASSGASKKSVSKRTL